MKKKWHVTSIEQLTWCVQNWRPLGGFCCWYSWVASGLARGSLWNWSFHSQNCSFGAKIAVKSIHKSHAKSLTSQEIMVRCLVPTDWLLDFETGHIWYLNQPSGQLIPIYRHFQGETQPSRSDQTVKRTTKHLKTPSCYHQKFHVCTTWPTLPGSQAQSACVARNPLAFPGANLWPPQASGRWRATTTAPAPWCRSPAQGHQVLLSQQLQEKCSFGGSLQKFLNVRTTNLLQNLKGEDLHKSPWHQRGNWGFNKNHLSYFELHMEQISNQVWEFSKHPNFWATELHVLVHM